MLTLQTVCQAFNYTFLLAPFSSNKKITEDIDSEYVKQSTDGK